jgi:HlyD family secretion protein
VLQASGRVESSKRTVIDCQLENIAVGVRGNRRAVDGASTLIKVVPDGTVVKRGDVLAVLDSSEYEELLRVQRISVERAKADRLQAELDFEIARLALVEFREGMMAETIEDFRGRIALAQADLERANDRFHWSTGMKAKGYVSASTVKTDELNWAKAVEALKLEESAFELFQKHSAPRTIHELEGTVLGAKAMLEYQELRTQRSIYRLANLEKQVQNCTIRAPHDGFVIHVNDARREIYVEEGMPVRQKQRLFYLPDLNEMEVVAQVHESIVDEVEPGLRAHVEIESLPGSHLTGQVTLVAPLATFDPRSDVRYFDAIVKLDRVPTGLRPGMSAQIEIFRPRKWNVLTVPSEAVVLASGQDVCFVLHEERVERRPVKLGEVTEDLTEVTHGLREGEHVVLSPPVDDAEFATTAAPPDAAYPEASPLPQPAPRGAIAAMH